MFPRVLGSIIRAARACGVPAIRNPFEPDWSLRLTNNAPGTRRLQVRTLRLFRERFLRAVHAAELRTTDGTLGVLATGTFDTDYVVRLLRNMPSGSWELVCHPGYVDSTLRRAGTRLIETRDAERQALLAALVEPPLDLPRIDLMHYGEFTA
jgi:predicted glycoside hydrolase/deacetylase ChbG (UPF0249 family)